MAFGSGQVNTVSIYPNPANSTLNVEFGMPQAGQVTLLLSDMLGKMRLLEKVSAQPGMNQLQLNIERLPAGIYMVSIRSACFTYRKQMEIW